MNWWSLKKLTVRLESGALGPAAQFGYMAGFVILELFTWAVDTVPWTAPELRNPVGGILVTFKIVEPLICFFANGGDKGHDFILRYVALSFPARIRGMVFLAFGLFPLAAFTGFFGTTETWTWEVLRVPYFFLGLNAIHFVYVYRALRGLSRSATRSSGVSASRGGGA